MIAMLALILVTQANTDPELRTLDSGQRVYCRPGEAMNLEGAHCSAFLRSGTAAPFDGLLLSKRLAAEVGVAASKCQEKCDLAVETATATAHLELVHQHRLDQIEIERLNAELGIADSQIQDLESRPPWYTWSAIGAIGALAAFVIPMLLLSR